MLRALLLRLRSPAFSAGGDAGADAGGSVQQCFVQALAYTAADAAGRLLAADAAPLAAAAAAPLACILKEGSRIMYQKVE